MINHNAFAPTAEDPICTLRLLEILGPDGVEMSSVATLGVHEIAIRSLYCDLHRRGLKLNTETGEIIDGACPELVGELGTQEMASLPA